MSVRVPASLDDGPILDALVRGAPSAEVVPARPKRVARESAVRRLLVLTDVAALAFAVGVIELLGGFHGGDSRRVLRDLALLAFAIPVWVVLAQAHNLYHADSRRADHGWTEEVAPIVQMATIWSWAILLGVSATGIRPVTIPKLAIFWVTTICLLLLLRSCTRAYARRRPWYVQRALIVGPTIQAAAVVRRVWRHPEYRLDVVGCISDDGPVAQMAGAERRQLRRLVGDVPVIGGNADLAELIHRMDVDRVVFTSDAQATRDGAEAMCALAELNVQVDLIPTWSDVVGRRLDYQELEGLPLLSVPRTRMRRTDQLRKRVLDVTLASIALFLLAPVLALLALLIKCDSPGPVFFRQTRVGRDNRMFQVFKLRSMFVDAEVRKHELATINLHGGGHETGMFKAREDPRITRMGRFIRRSSLDELPQLFNVVRGDMSLVGPRPLIENEDRQVEGRLRRRLVSSPGLTGPWQIHGRSEIPFEEMINLDYLYVTNWSMWSDIKLLLRTVRAVVRGQGAY